MQWSHDDSPSSCFIVAAALLFLSSCGAVCRAWTVNAHKQKKADWSAAPSQGRDSETFTLRNLDDFPVTAVAGLEGV